MSSTVLTSLMTGAPVIADDAVLRAYTFLTREDVFLMREGEDEVDVMLRVRAGRGAGGEGGWLGGGLRAGSADQSALGCGSR